jgi:magnesium chelatase subunit D
VRDAFLAKLPMLPLPLRRIHPTISDEALYGGVDLAATLADGFMRRSRGMLEDDAALVLTMAERCPAGLGARLAHALDQPGHCLVALDESLEEDDGLPIALIDRVGLFVDLDGLPYGVTEEDGFDTEELAGARSGFRA